MLLRSDQHGSARPALPAVPRTPRTPETPTRKGWATTRLPAQSGRTPSLRPAKEGSAFLLVKHRCLRRTATIETALRSTSIPNEYQIFSLHNNVGREFSPPICSEAHSETIVSLDVFAGSALFVAKCGVRRRGKSLLRHPLVGDSELESFKDDVVLNVPTIAPPALSALFPEHRHDEIAEVRAHHPLSECTATLFCRARRSPLLSPSQHRLFELFPNAFRMNEVSGLGVDHCFAFVNWDEDEFDFESEKIVVFRSLVATVKSQPALDASLEAKALKLLESVNPDDEESADEFLGSFGQTTDESLNSFIQSILVLISSPCQVITSASMKMFRYLILWSSAETLLDLVKANLIPRLIFTLNPQTLSFAEAEPIHITLYQIFGCLFYPATPSGLDSLKIEDRDGQQAVHETILKQVVAPVEKYIWHLCVNRFSFVHGTQSMFFQTLLVRILRISPYYQLTMDFILRMPIFLAIPSCLTFFENDGSMRSVLHEMIETQWEWNDQGGKVRQLGNTMHRMLRMEGIENVNEETLQNNKNGSDGRWVLFYSFRWNKMQGMNLPRHT
ncbi:hypothetical protein BLNAU_3314 [Blattamonas nauphoetae]|uniref:Uncharacterized protein n=1 Tax=Blattamonas nauphoetae TaxID=2049346 RepID=A0ABQ9YDP3_9EUKA|nr:hypothetical protein BLNAU_3314 [Blattamonas nauphoetae]